MQCNLKGYGDMKRSGKVDTNYFVIFLRIYKSVNKLSAKFCMLIFDVEPNF